MDIFKSIWKKRARISIRYLSESEIQNVFGGFIGFAAIATKGVDVVGGIFTLREMFRMISDYFEKESAKLVEDYKQDPNTVNNRHSFNGDL